MEVFGNGPKARKDGRTKFRYEMMRDSTTSSRLQPVTHFVIRKKRRSVVARVELQDSSQKLSTFLSLSQANRVLKKSCPGYRMPSKESTAGNWRKVHMKFSDLPLSLNRDLSCIAPGDVEAKCWLYCSPRPDDSTIALSSQIFHPTKFVVDYAPSRRRRERTELPTEWTGGPEHQSSSTVSTLGSNVFYTIIVLMGVVRVEDGTFYRPKSTGCKCYGMNRIGQRLTCDEVPAPILHIVHGIPAQPIE